MIEDNRFSTNALNSLNHILLGEGYWGKYLWKMSVGVCDPLPKALTLFMIVKK